MSIDELEEELKLWGWEDEYETDIRDKIIRRINKKKREEYKQKVIEIVKSKFVLPTEEYAKISKEYTPIETYKYVFPIEEYATISKKYNDKRKVKIPKFKVTKNNIHDEEFKSKSNVTGNEDEIKK